METFISIAIGVGLAAACGFRVFVPLLMLNLAALSGFVALPSGFAWMGSHAATIAFATATILEISGYYVPWLDHILDTIASPAAVLAGTLTTASMIADVSPFFKWTMALIAGGGIAGLVQASTVALRAKSSLVSAGAANPVFATAELAGAVVISLIAIFIPVACLILVVLFLIWALKKILKKILKRTKTPGNH